MTEKQIIKKCEEIRELCGLSSNWSIGYMFVECDDEAFKEFKPEFAKTITAIIDTGKGDYNSYRRVNIYFNKKNLKSINIFTIIHEFVHIIYAPFREYAAKHMDVKDNWEMFCYLEETCTTDMENTIARALLNNKIRKKILKDI